MKLPICGVLWPPWLVRLQSSPCSFKRPDSLCVFSLARHLNVLQERRPFKVQHPRLLNGHEGARNPSGEFENSSAVKRTEAERMQGSGSYLVASLDSKFRKLFKKTGGSNTG